MIAVWGVLKVAVWGGCVTAFVDWLSGVLPFEESLPDIADGSFVVLNRNGIVESIKPRRLPVNGSWDDKLYVRNGAGGLEFSGNPAKWLQGHNLWGPSPYASLGEELGLAIAHALDITPTERDRELWWWGIIELTRIDITRMIDSPGAPEGWAKTWLRVALQRAHGGHQQVSGAAHKDVATLYLGQKSRRISLKIYEKGAELVKHPQPMLERPGLRSLAQAYARDTLRVEVTLRGMELRDRKLSRLGLWTGPIADDIIDERIGKLSLPGSMSMAPSLPDGAPLRLQQAYALWIEGRELRALYSRATFFRLRRQLLEYGVDIAKTRPRIIQTPEEDTLGRPLKDFLTGPGMYPPSWAIDAEWLAARPDARNRGA